MSTRGVGIGQQMFKNHPMGIGSRIKSRLDELGWQRKHLYDALPDLTAQAQCGVFASLGQPSRINNTTNSRGTSSQLVYEHGNYPYVYTEEIPGYQTQAVRSFRH